jgi:hypothetical protein
MWVYEQSSGQLSQRVAIGYSGLEEAKNQPDLQDVKDRGPIPRGRWSVGAPFDGGSHGPYCLRLTPTPETVTHGRGGFLVHGDSISAPGTASHGCIILPRAVRERIWNSGDHDLEVTR